MAKVHRISKITGAAATGTPKVHRISKITGKATVAAVMSVSLGADVLGLEPYTTVTITPVLTNGGGAVLAIEQTMGPAVIIGGTGPWTYRTPGVMNVQGAHLAFQVVAVLGGDEAFAEVHHFVYPNTIGYANTSGQLVAAEFIN